MGFGSQVHNQVGLEVDNQLANLRGIGNIGTGKLVALVVCY